MQFYQNRITRIRAGQEETVPMRLFYSTYGSGFSSEKGVKNNALQAGVFLV